MTEKTSLTSQIKDDANLNGTDYYRISAAELQDIGAIVNRQADPENNEARTDSGVNGGEPVMIAEDDQF